MIHILLQVESLSTTAFAEWEQHTQHCFAGLVVLCIRSSWLKASQAISMADDNRGRPDFWARMALEFARMGVGLGTYPVFPGSKIAGQGPACKDVGLGRFSSHSLRRTSHQCWPGCGKPMTAHDQVRPWPRGSVGMHLRRKADDMANEACFPRVERPLKRRRVYTDGARKLPSEVSVVVLD